MTVTTKSMIRFCHVEGIVLLSYVWLLIPLFGMIVLVTSNEFRHQHQHQFQHSLRLLQQQKQQQQQQQQQQKLTVLLQQHHFLPLKKPSSRFFGKNIFHYCHNCHYCIQRKEESRTKIPSFVVPSEQKEYHHARNNEKHDGRCLFLMLLRFKKQPSKQSSQWWSMKQSTVFLLKDVLSQRGGSISSDATTDDDHDDNDESENKSISSHNIDENLGETIAKNYSDMNDTNDEKHISDDDSLDEKSGEMEEDTNKADDNFDHHYNSDDNDDTDDDTDDTDDDNDDDTDDKDDTDDQSGENNRNRDEVGEDVNEKLMNDDAINLDGSSNEDDKFAENDNFKSNDNRNNTRQKSNAIGQIKNYENSYTRDGESDGDDDDNLPTTILPFNKVIDTFVQNENETSNDIENGTVFDDKSISEYDKNDNVDNDNGESTILKEATPDDDDDDERYSRQLYTVGAKAFGRIRSSIVYLDGPVTSGLLYECAKNLALSGVRKIVIVGNTSDDYDDNDDNDDNDAKIASFDSDYFYEKLDDLGRTYAKGAQAELNLLQSSSTDSNNHLHCRDNESSNDASSNEENNRNLLVQYLKRLNPNLVVTTIDRSTLLTLLSSENRPTKKMSDADRLDQSNAVLVCIDRPYPTQVLLNKVARSNSGHFRPKIKYVSVETAGIYGKVFCDFGSASHDNDSFEVYDSDGEIPLETPLEKVVPVTPESINPDDSDDVGLVVYCVEGEKHDLSKGDTIEFQYRTNSNNNNNVNQRHPHKQWIVTQVDSPYRIRVRLADTLGIDKGKNSNSVKATNDAIDVPSLVLYINENASSFHRIKIPQLITFQSLEEATNQLLLTNSDKTTKSSKMSMSSWDRLFTACDLEKSFDETRKRTILQCFRTLSTFVQKYHRLPSEDDVRIFSEELSILFDQDDNVDSSSFNVAPTSLSLSPRAESFVRTFVTVCAAKFTPLQAMFGSLAAQEALKAVTGLYNPIQQFLLYDCDEVLASKKNKKQKKRSRKRRNDRRKHRQPVDSSATTTTMTTMMTSIDNEVVQDKSQKNCQGLRYILGDRVVNRMQKKNIFVVGCGAIGCELLKNLAAMGFGRSTGKIIITDMDTIEKSNLSRQLLFREGDIGKLKSYAARDACLRLEPNMNVIAYSSKVGEDNNHNNFENSNENNEQHPHSQNPFDETFWSKTVHVVLNALDNVEARLYMDRKCVEHRIALIDAGTMGPKGNVQVVIPHQSESYASSVDPPEPSIPLCTIKSFPYAIAHTIQWARSLFDNLYEQRPEHTNQFIEIVQSSTTSPSLSSSSSDDLLNFLASKYVREMGDESAIERVREIREDLDALHSSNDEQLQSIRQAALNWAVQLSIDLFHKAALDIITKHPLDSLDDEGELFWSGTRRPPKVIQYHLTATESDNDDETITVTNEQKIINDNLIRFVSQAARLRAETILGKCCHPGDSFFGREEVEQALVSLWGKYSNNQSTTTTKSTKSNINNNHSTTPTIDDNDNGTQSSMSQVRDVLLGAQLPRIGRKFVAIEFEKDDETNGHVAFVSAASNLRAISYGIAPVPDMETRRIAGKIVPAMITTTAVVSALSCLELIKVVQTADLVQHRNAFINLALPFFAFTMPMPAEEYTGIGGKQYTLWDRHTIHENSKHVQRGGISIQSLLRRIVSALTAPPSSTDSTTTVAVSSISVGPYLLYADFLNGNDKLLMKRSLWSVIQEATESTFSHSNDLFNEHNTGRTEELNPYPPVSFLNNNYVDLTVVVVDLETMEEVEVPPVRVHRYKQKRQKSKLTPP